MSFAASVRAADVDLCTQETPGETIKEAVVRMRAELVAAGFSVEPSACGDVPAVLGRIELEIEGTSLEIRATARSSMSTMIQHANLTHTNITAEVIAVRAVEALRAVLLQSLRSGEMDQASISPSLRAFAEFESDEGHIQHSPELVPDTAATVKAPSKTKAANPRRSLTPEARRWAGMFSLGPSIEFYPGVPSWAAGIEGRGLVHYDWVSLGIVAQGALMPAQISVGAEQAQARTWSILLRPGIRMNCGTDWECHLGLLAGLSSVSLSAETGPDESSSAVRHLSGNVQADVMLGRFFRSGLGALLQLRGGALLNAPVLSSSAGDASVTWGRPVIGVSLALGYRL